MPVRSAPVTTMVLVLDAWLNCLENHISDVNFIYDEKQSYTSSLQAIRKKYTRDNITDKTHLPLFSFKRSVLRYPEDGQSRRSVTNRALAPRLPDGLSRDCYRGVHAEFDIEFGYYADSITEEEAFEITYLSEDGISGDKEIKVDLPDLGEHTYYATYSPLESKVFEMDDIYHKEVRGVVTLRGFYYIIHSSANVITQINSRIKHFNDRIISQTQLPQNDDC